MDVLQPPVIAIVDDDDAIRIALSSLVRSMGYDVRLYAEAEAYLVDDSIPSAGCVITDIQMPGMNGLQLQTAIRRRTPRLPVIVITAFPEDAIREQALADGAMHFLSKPFAATTMARCLVEAVGTADRNQ